MEKKISIGVSGRHIHLTQQTYDLLFDEPMNNIRNLNQPHMFVSDKTVTLYNENYQIDNVKLIGPCRNYDQIEISHSDALKFKIDPPVRAAGEVDGGATLTVKTAKGEVTLPFVIIAERHVHITKEEAMELGLQNKQIVKVKIDGIKAGVIEAHIKATDEAYFEMHIDTDDANAFIINDSNNTGTMIY